MSKKNVSMSSELSFSDQQFWMKARKNILNMALVYFKHKGFVNGQAEEFAEDATHDVLLKLMNKRDAFDGTKASYLTWASRVAKNHFHDIHRAKKNYSEEVFEPHHSPSSDDEYDFVPEELVSMLKYLSSKDAQILEMKFLQAKSGREISQILGLKESSVPMNVRRAKEKLRKIATSRLGLEGHPDVLVEPAQKYSFAA
jgi:RNA polymerase sigma-70 factor (ECF subfamily)